MNEDQKTLAADFHRAMLETYDAATRLDPPYRPTDFRRMLTQQGGRKTAQLLLDTNQPSSGFSALYSRGKENSRLSVEYLALSEPWRRLFTPAQLATASKRLREIGFAAPDVDHEIRKTGHY